MEPFGRRTLLKGGIIGILAPKLALAQDDPASVRPREGDFLVRTGDPGMKPLTPQDIPIGTTQIMAWAMDPSGTTVRSGSRLNRVLLTRFDPAILADETRPLAADGVLAYTAICTHNGCEVDEWLTTEQLLSCPCHDSKFDPRDGGKVVDGPAPRPLPALPLQLVDGKLTVAQPFTSRVGFETA